MRIVSRSNVKLMQWIKKFRKLKRKYLQRAKQNRSLNKRNSRRARCRYSAKRKREMPSAQNEIKPDGNDSLPLNLSSTLLSSASSASSSTEASQSGSSSSSPLTTISEIISSSDSGYDEEELQLPDRKIFIIKVRESERFNLNLKNRKDILDFIRHSCANSLSITCNIPPNFPEGHDVRNVEFIFQNLLGEVIRIRKIQHLFEASLRRDPYSPVQMHRLILSPRKPIRNVSTSSSNNRSGEALANGTSDSCNKFVLANDGTVASGNCITAINNDARANNSLNDNVAATSSETSGPSRNGTEVYNNLNSNLGLYNDNCNRVVTHYRIEGINNNAVDPNDGTAATINNNMTLNVTNAATASNNISTTVNNEASSNRIVATTNSAVRNGIAVNNTPPINNNSNVVINGRIYPSFVTANNVDLYNLITSNSAPLYDGRANLNQNSAITNNNNVIRGTTSNTAMTSGNINNNNSVYRPPNRIFSYGTTIVSMHFRGIKRPLILDDPTDPEPTEAEHRKRLKTNNGEYRNVSVLEDRYVFFNKVHGTNFHFCIDVNTRQRFLCKVSLDHCTKLIEAHESLKFHPFLNHLVSHFRRGDKTYMFYPVIPVQNNLLIYVRERKYLNEKEACYLFRQICSIVNACHVRGIVLRDLKMRKFVFIDENRKQLKLESLVDAVVLDNPRIDFLKEKRGCPVYVAPEILVATHAYCGKTADMWSLGVILYTMLTGKYPFNDEDHAGLFMKISRAIYTMPDFISPKASCLIRQLLRRDPTKRITCEDIFFHPWMQTKEEYTEKSFDDTDQCVPTNDFVGKK